MFYICWLIVVAQASNRPGRVAEPSEGLPNTGFGRSCPQGEELGVHGRCIRLEQVVIGSDGLFQAIRSSNWNRVTSTIAQLGQRAHVGDFVNMLQSRNEQVGRAAAPHHTKPLLYAHWPGDAALTCTPVMLPLAGSPLAYSCTGTHGHQPAGLHGPACAAGTRHPLCKSPCWSRNQQTSSVS